MSSVATIRCGLALVRRTAQPGQDGFQVEVRRAQLTEWATLISQGQRIVLRNGG